MKDSFYLFSFKGIPFRAHWLLLIFLLFRIFRDSNPLAFKYNLAIAGIFLISVIVHELGHALTARRVGATAKEIVLWPLGGLAYTSNHGTLQNSLKITLGGPLTHIPLAILFATAAYLIEGKVPWTAFSPFFSQMPEAGFWGSVMVIGVKVQVILFLFNLFVPAYPLDCGHAIVEIMLIKGKSPEVTAKTIIGLSAIAAAVLIFYFQDIIIGAFIIYSTWQLNTLRVSGQLRSHPLFRLALDLKNKVKSPRRPSHLKLVEKKLKPRKCPTCGKEVSPSAVMCGFCEKVLPK